MLKQVLVGVVASLATAIVIWIAGIIGQFPPILFIPSGAVIAFDTKECPTPGWEEHKQAYGRFVRGIDRSGDNIDPQGERNPGSIQEDELASHFHSRPNDVHSGSQAERAWIAPARHFSYANGNPDTGSKGGKETRPVNVALLYCKKL